MMSLKPHPEAQKKFEPFVDSILTSHQDIIHSIHLTGSVLTTDYDPKHSDINSIVILKQMNLSSIENLAPLGKKYGKKSISAPLVMTPEYIQQSLDVFPIEFLEIKLLHHTWMGEDIFKDIQINPSDLRRQCERELKIRLIGLRQDYISSIGNRKILTDSFIGALSGYIPLFRGLILLHGKEPPLENADVLSLVAETMGVNIEPFKSIWKLKRERSKPSLQQLNTLFEDCYGIVEKLGDVINALDV